MKLYKVSLIKEESHLWLFSRYFTDYAIAKEFFSKCERKIMVKDLGQSSSYTDTEERDLYYKVSGNKEAKRLIFRTYSVDESSELTDSIINKL